MLLRALGALARSGFVVPPSEALDLIHDFFVDGWPSVRTNYNRKKGPLPNYVYVSFVHYARPRIVKLNRLRSALIDRDAREVRGSSPEFALETGAAAMDGSDPQASGAGTAISATVSAWKPGVGAETGDGHRPFPLRGTRTTGSFYRESDCGLRSTAEG